MFPTPLHHRLTRRELYFVRLAFNRIVGRMQALGRTSQSWKRIEQYSRETKIAPSERAAPGPAALLQPGYRASRP